MVTCKDTLKFLLNRVKGVQYGGVLSGGKVSLVKTEKLSKLIAGVDKYTDLPTEYRIKLSEEQYNIIKRMTKPVRNTSLPEYNEDMRYVSYHGNLNIGNADNSQVLTIAPKLEHPLRELFKFGF